MGYRADVAANGLEVLDALERQPYDVILMDVQMPEMDGLEATRQIEQRWPPAQRPRIVAMTANAMQGDRDLVPQGRYGRLYQQAGAYGGADRCAGAQRDQPDRRASRCPSGAKPSPPSITRC